jgi:hypothetical protein
LRSISIKGVLIGGIVDIVASVVCGLPFALYTLSRTGFSSPASARTTAEVTAAIHGNVPLYVGQSLVGLACSVLGGYLAARVAKHDELLNGGLSAFLCVALGVYTIATGQNADLIWVKTFVLVVSPALGLLGGEVARRRPGARSLPA